MKAEIEVRGKQPLSERRTLGRVEEDMTDRYGNHLNHALALLLLASDRASILNSQGIPASELYRENGPFEVRRIEARYLSQAFNGDSIQITTQEFPGTKGSLVFRQKMEKTGTPVLEAYVTLGQDTMKPLNVTNFGTPLLEMKKPIVIGDEMKDPIGTRLDPALGLRVFEAERMRALEENGIPPYEMGEKFGVLAFVHDLETVYNEPAYLGHIYEVASTLYQRRGSLIFHHRLQKFGENLIEATVRLALVDTNGKLRRIPKEFLNHFRKKE